MENMNTLLRSQRNSIFNALTEGGLDESIVGDIKFVSSAQEFRAYDDKDDDGSGIALTLKEDGHTFFFYFVTMKGKWACHAFPCGPGG